MEPPMKTLNLRSTKGTCGERGQRPEFSHSALDIHICWKTPREARNEPPMRTLNLRSTRDTCGG